MGFLRAAASAIATQPQPKPDQQKPPASGEVVVPGQPTFRARIDLVTTDVIVRDDRGQFVADLKREEFEVYEDGVKQEIVSLVLTHGGRVFNQATPPPPPAQEGIILPPARPTNDAAGRIFLIFVDDLHLDFRNTRAHPRAVQEDLDDADSRRRHVRHRLDRPLVDLRSI